MKKFAVVHTLALCGPLLATGAVMAPSLVSAQSNDVVCNKCVDTRDIDRRAVTRGRLANGAVNFGRLQTRVEQAIKQDKTFYVTLNGNGDEATLVSQGPLRMFARCVLNDGGEDRVEILVTSTANGWYALTSPMVRNAGDEVPVNESDTAVTAGNPASLRTPAFGAIAPDGSAIGLGAALVGVGLNIFGHKCLVYGRAGVITGAL